jgi:hypothetical protein
MTKTQTSTMFTRPPLAAIYCYVLAALAGTVAIVTMGTGLLGSVISSGKNDPFHLNGLIGQSFLLVGFVQLLAAGGFAAAGAVIHDIRRIAENTSAIAARREDAASSSFSRGSMAQTAEPVFFYFEKSVEHGPLSKLELAALIRSNQVSPFQRIEKSVNGIRQTFEMRDLE